MVNSAQTRYKFHAVTKRRHTGGTRMRSGEPCQEERGCHVRLEAQPFPPDKVPDPQQPQGGGGSWVQCVSQEVTGGGALCSRKHLGRGWRGRHLSGSAAPGRAGIRSRGQCAGAAAWELVLLSADFGLRACYDSGRPCGGWRLSLLGHREGGWSYRPHGVPAGP